MTFWHHFQQRGREMIEVIGEALATIYRYVVFGLIVGLLAAFVGDALFGVIDPSQLLSSLAPYLAGGGLFGFICGTVVAVGPVH